MSATVLICLSLIMSDGDSGRCHTADGRNIPVRLQGVDSGEVAPFTRCQQRPNVWACSPVARSTGGQARTRARQLASAGARCTDTGQRSWDRWVVVCTVNGRDLGGTLVREGLAISETNFGDRYRSEERQARAERRGMWR